MQGAQRLEGGWRARRALADLVYTDLSCNISVNASAVERTAAAVSDIVAQGRLLVRLRNLALFLHLLTASFWHSPPEGQLGKQARQAELHAPQENNGCSHALVRAGPTSWWQAGGAFCPRQAPNCMAGAQRAAAGDGPDGRLAPLPLKLPQLKQPQALNPVSGARRSPAPTTAWTCAISAW